MSETALHIPPKQLRSDYEFMSLALLQAKQAFEAGEVPVGAVIVKDGKVISRAHNLTESRNTPLGHAELLAIDGACRAVNDWRLGGATIYVTLEPCPMCAGAIINSRIERVVFGAFDKSSGSFGSIIDLSKLGLNSAPRLTGGIMAEECAKLLRDFFINIRGGVL